MTDDRAVKSQADSGWAMAGVAFAATMMLMIGGFQVIIGLAAILNDDYFVRVRGYAFNLDITAWGWIHLILGLALIAAGIGLFSRAVWAGVAALFLVVLSAIDNFFFIPYQPFWALLLIALDVWIIWALTRPRALRT
ncbi:DUF7144 family membrane protein [Kribbella pratensis]|jgi:hypothetical protein|uniref:DUF7144 domain-containing protein n=1 Tax=Kribbella pratensis TaxID=2512112 RepID=A0A4R8CME1_9ACTN|nr:hypothetical protein [Kribbella pratensis]TDW77241.1 hypothetical protein EV653_2406 [Kribbella pratensis]